MMATRATLLLLPWLALASACGDDGVKASDYEGTWLIESMTVPTEAGELTLTRDGVPDAIRGDVVFTATGDTTATMNARQVLLVQGLPADQVSSTDLAVAVEEGRWVLTETDGVTVFDVMKHDGDALMLTVDLTDPRTTTTNPPREIMVRRVTPWGTACVGAWDLVSMTSAGGTITANVCTELVAGQRWGKLQMAVSFDGRLLFSRTMTMTTYADAACTSLVSTESSLQAGLAEEDAGAALRIWALEGDNAEHLAFTISEVGEVMTLTRTACLPMPSCASEAPTTVVVRRH